MREQRIEHSADAVLAHRMAIEFAREIGFDRRACVEIAIATSELAVNIAKYGVRGVITLAAIRDPEHGVGIAITASDEGPPFLDFELAKRDGFDDHGRLAPEQLLGRGGYGTGLGAVARLTDRLDLETRPGKKRIIAVRYTDRPATMGGDPPARPARRS